VHTDRGDPRHGPLGEHQTEELYSFVDLTFYGEAHWSDEGEMKCEEDGTPIIWLACRTETMVYTATDPFDYGTLQERDSDLSDDDLDVFCESVEEADRLAKMRAEEYLTNYPYLIHRDIIWDGLAKWEREPWLP
jgi:hypothetical protein